MTELENIITRLKIGRADFHDLREVIDAAVAEGRVKERRACVKACELAGTVWGGKEWNNAIAACVQAIRARGTP